MSDDDKKYAAPPDEFPDKGESGSGSTVGYSVEARYAYYKPLPITEDFTLDLRWRRIPINTRGPIGVPDRNAWHGDAIRYGLHSWEAAQALRWWFLADLETQRNLSTMCVETRIVEHKITYSFSVEATGATDPQDFRSDRFPSRKKPEPQP